MDTVLFKTEDFKETLTGFVFTIKCDDAENRKFGIEALKPDGSYEEITVLTKAQGDTFEIHEKPFDGRIIYT